MEFTPPPRFDAYTKKILRQIKNYRLKISNYKTAENTKVRHRK